MPTLEELTDLDQGCLLITGPRRSGKTFICSSFIERWEQRKLNYKFFSIHQPTSTWGRWGGTPSMRNMAPRLRGHRIVLVDEPEHNFPIDPFWPYLNEGLLVLASSDPEGWMIGQANWVIHSGISGNYSFEPGRPFRVPPKPRLSIWERLSAEEWCI